MYAEPFCKGSLKHEEISGFAGIEGAVHVGRDENAEVGWQLQLVKSEDVVVVDCWCSGVEEYSSEM